mgnify:FL=1
MNYIIKHIDKFHPNRPCIPLQSIKAIVIHYTQNDMPQADAVFHYKYLNRPYITKINEQQKKLFFEKDGITPFRYGSAHVFCDMNNIIETIPLNEVAWSCGDKNYKRDYKPIAYNIFQKKQNYQTINVEICNNDIIKKSQIDWQGAVENAKLFIKDYLRKNNLKIDIEKSLNPQIVKPIELKENNILLLRHFDITGKICPKPFIDSIEEWQNFIKSFTD